MKLIIESLDTCNAKITLNFKGKDYSELWINKENRFSREGDIVKQLESDGICAEGTDIEDMLSNINIVDFMDLSQREEKW